MRISGPPVRIEGCGAPEAPVSIRLSGKSSVNPGASREDTSPTACSRGAEARGRSGATPATLGLPASSVGVSRHPPKGGSPSGAIDLVNLPKARSGRHKAFHHDLPGVAAGLPEIVGHLHPRQVSGVEPKASDSRIATSTDIPVRPFTCSKSACRVTSKPSAARVTVRPRGSRHCRFTMPSGCGVHIDRPPRRRPPLDRPASTSTKPRTPLPIPPAAPGSMASITASLPQQSPHHQLEVSLSQPVQILLRKQSASSFVCLAKQREHPALEMLFDAANPRTSERDRA